MCLHSEERYQRSHGIVLDMCTLKSREKPTWRISFGVKSLDFLLLAGLPTILFLKIAFNGSLATQKYVYNT
jgi:hypothetical protein